MQIDIKAKEVKPVRQNYSHIANRVGADRPATRYQEAIYDVQATANFHYRPTWEPEKELYDQSRTAIQMEDWYRFLDPRQYYYGTYCMARAKQQDSAEKNFKFVEKHGLLDLLPDDVKQVVLDFVVPLRHYEWGANMNNSQICASGYGTAITAPAMLHAADRLGNAQYLTRIGLLLSGNDASVIDHAKERWVDEADFQPLRKAVEDSLVVSDWFELFLAQNLILDAVIHPLFFQHLEQQLTGKGGSAYAMLTEFTVDWYDESRRWVDKQIATAAAESAANKAILGEWYEQWAERARGAAAPLAAAVLEDGDGALAAITSGLEERAAKNGISL